MSRIDKNIVVVSLHKSGTNLIKLPLVACGLDVGGFGIAESYNRLWFKECSLRAVLAAGNDMAGLRAEFASRFFKKAGSMWGPDAVFLHWLPMGKYLRKWTKEGKPKIVFHYRDPRAITVSLYHYLLSSKKMNYPPVAVMSKIVKSLPDKESRFQYLIDGAGWYFDDIRESVWLRFHPDVLSTNYESLVGSSGGGSDISQEQTLGRLLDCLDLRHKQEAALAALNTRSGRTFRSGHAHNWREEFPESMLGRFEKRHGDIIEALGYSLDGA
jgi:hypothetical protein